MSFSNKMVAVTGGTGALGRVVAQAFLDAGAVVSSSFILDREVAALPASLREHARFSTHRVELTSADSVDAWFADMGGLDILVNIAGGFAMGTVQDTSPGDWNQMIAMNLETCFLTCHAAMKQFSKCSDHKRIINIGAFAATQRLAGMTAYKVSKAGVIHLTESLAEETLACKTTVNALLPTIMDTPSNRLAMPDEDFSKWVPLDNVAKVILFLSSDDAWPITGACLPLRGHC